MGSVIGDLLPLAVGIAISPVPIMAAILMLFTPRASSTSASFLVGWVAGIAGGVVVFNALAGLMDGGDSDDPSAAVSWVKLVLGLLFLALAVKQWRGRPRGDNEPAVPGWMAAIDKITPVRALGLSVLLSAVNPKNLAMAIAAGVTIGSADLGVGQQTVAIVVFTAIAASSVAIPVLAFTVAADRFRGPLDDLRAWLGANTAVIMTVLFVVLGTMLVGRGLGGLL